MNLPWILLAEETAAYDSLSSSWHSLGGSLKDIVLIFGAVAVVTAVVVVWAIYFRKRHRHHHHHHGSSEVAVASSHDAGSGHRRRRRRRSHRPRNPTLAETGGLPPVRPERPPEPFP